MNSIHPRSHGRVNVPSPRGSNRKILWGANPWSDAPRPNTNTTSGTPTASAPVAIATFVVIVVLVVIAFLTVLWCARRRRLRREARKDEASHSVESQGSHVLVILPDNRLACGEVQLDKKEEEEEEEDDDERQQQEEQIQDSHQLCQ